MTTETTQTKTPLEHLIREALYKSKTEVRARGHEWDVADAYVAVMEALHELSSPATPT